MNFYSCIAYPCEADRVDDHTFCKQHLLDYQKKGHYRMPKTNKDAGRVK